MTARQIDGKQIAADLRAAIALGVDELEEAHRVTPGLAVVLVGEDPASQVYVRNKGKATLEAGMKSFEHKLPATTTQAELLEIVQRMNADDSVDGILVQLPLPKHIDANAVLDAIHPDKDVDGFHPINAGRLAIGRPGLVPCTPSGSMRLIRAVEPKLAGKHAVVIGRSNIVGKPMAQLLLAADCTVTIAHSKTADLPAMARQADILIAAVGRPEMVSGDWVKPGAIVIDVGINRVPAADGKTKLVGDVHYQSAAEKAGAITPVPGGVGPMTIACLLENTLRAAKLRRGIKL
ncbi:MAG: bifunctional methylenetetrahydrofolate dehydrogenase/methenyltetrahydrofolate cyclohydrolase FolD [Tagaea sp. CACIAM 22H2]|nr:bifunctional methylenetetrahydrofolate dehydrogenase/methenyltetrahydrofolate cyclohydrolase FolD [Tagaea sp. CACIAM 22H2]